MYCPVIVLCFLHATNVSDLTWIRQIQPVPFSTQVAAMSDEDLRSEAQRKQQSAARNEGLQARKWHLLTQPEHQYPAIKGQPSKLRLNSKL